MFEIQDPSPTESQLSFNDADEEELSYGEILASAILNGEIIITIPAEDEDRVKGGIKGHKNKQAIRMREEGQPVDSASLLFNSVPSKDFQGCVDLSIQYKVRGTVRIKNIRIPENDLPI